VGEGTKRDTLLRAAFLVVLTFVAYLPAIRGGFIWDDDTHVTENIALRSLFGLKLIWFKLGATPQYYPLTHTSFWVQWHLFGANPLPYHLANVVMHTASALILWRILVMLEIRGAFLAAAIFALHPVQVESVAWVSERKNVLSGLFYMLAAWAYLKADTRGYVLSLIAFTAAVLSKTVAGSLPAALLLVLWWKHGRITRRQILWLLPMFVIAIVMGRITSSMERWNVGATGPEWDYGFVQRMLIAGRAVWFYVLKIVFPIELSFIYPKWKLDSWAWIFPLAGVIVIIALWLGRAWWGRGPLAATLFFVGTLIPALGFVNVYPMRYSFVADHFQYLASIGIIVLIAQVFVRWERAASVVLPLVLAVLTWQRAEAFSNPESLWVDTLDKNPSAWIAHDQLGAILANRNDVEQAAGHFATAIELEPHHIEAYIGMGNLMLYQENNAQEAVVWMRKAVAVRPDRPLPHYVLGKALRAAGDLSGAVGAFEAAIRVSPQFVPAYLQLAEVYTAMGQPDKAEEQKRAAQRIFREAFGYDARP
jgi:Flp pilus assembly protein TadD